MVSLSTKPVVDTVEMQLVTVEISAPETAGAVVVWVLVVLDDGPSGINILILVVRVVSVIVRVVSVIVRVVSVIVLLMVVVSKLHFERDTVTVWVTVTVTGLVRVIEFVMVTGTTEYGVVVYAGESVDAPTIVSVTSP